MRTLTGVRGVRRRALLIGGALALSLPGAGAAGAEPPPVGAAVSWRAPDGCPTPEQLTALVERHLGGPLGSAAAVRVEVELGRDEGGWVARIDTRWDGRRERREVRGAGCATVADAAALIVALRLQALPAAAAPTAIAGAVADIASARTLVVAPPPRHARVAIAQPAGTVADDHRVAPARADPPRRLHLAVSPTYALDATTLPAASLGAGVALALERGHLQAELLAARWPARMAPLSDGLGATIGLWTMAARGCLAVRPSLLACAGVEGGALTGDLVGVPGGRRGDGRWLAALAGAGTRWPLFGPVSSFARVEAVGAVARPRFVLDDGTVLHRPPVLGGRALGGITVQLR